MDIVYVLLGFIFYIRFGYTFTFEDINKRFLRVNFAVYPNTRLDDVDSDLFVLKYHTYINREEK